MKRLSVTVACTAALLVAAGVWFLHRNGTVTSAEPPVASAAPAGDVELAGGDGSNAVAQQPTDAAASVGSLPRPAAAVAPYVVEASASDAATALERLVPMAEAGDARAVAAIQRIYSRCLPFVGAPNARAKITAEPGTPDHAMQAASIERGQRYCNDARLASSAQLAAWLRDAFRTRAEAGDEAAIAHVLGKNALGLSQPEEAALAWDIVRTTQDPIALERALNAINSGRLGDSARSVGGDASPEFALFNNEQQIVREAAAMWLACSMGAPCGPNGSFQTTQCLYLGNCATHLSVQAFIRDRFLSATQFEQMQRYLAAIAALRAAPPGA